MRAEPGPSAAPRRLWHSRLWRKYALLLAGTSTAVVGGYGLTDLWAAYRSALAQAEQLQRGRAQELRHAVQVSLRTLQASIGGVQRLPLEDTWLGMRVRYEEYGRLMRLIPALDSVRYLDREGQERLVVSRRDLDRTAFAPGTAAGAGSGRPPAARPDPPEHRVSYTDERLPVLDLRYAEADAQGGGTTHVQVSLLAWSREMGDALSSTGGEAFLVDGLGHVALHQDAVLLLSRKAVGEVPAAATPLSGPGVAEAALQALMPAVGLHGQAVMRQHLAVPELGWFVVVDQARERVMAPVLGALARTGAFMVLGAVLSLLGAAWLAGRLTRPVRLLHSAAQQLTQGLTVDPVQLNTQDELQDLAQQFNDMAASLRQNVAELERRVDEKTRDLQRANQHKSDFLANMSHELRTPLNAILGFADVLREGMAGPISAEQLEYLGDIHASGLHLLSLINDVLDLSRIEAGQLALEIEPFDLPEMLQSAVALVRQRAVQKGLSLGLNLQPGLSQWTGDARRLKQVVLNLLSNAVKFTPSGGHVMLDAALSDQSLVLAVQDDGPGIAPESHELAFEAFRQVGRDAAGRAEGSGLGLALVRRLVHQHQGRIELFSALGLGARFVVTLPQLAPQVMGAGEATPPAQVVACAASNHEESAP